MRALPGFKQVNPGMSTIRQARLAPVSHGRPSPIGNNSDWWAWLANKVKKQRPTTTPKLRHQLHRHHRNDNNNRASPSYKGREQLSRTDRDIFGRLSLNMVTQQGAGMMIKSSHTQKWLIHQNLYKLVRLRSGVCHGLLLVPRLRFAKSTIVPV